MHYACKCGFKGIIRFLCEDGAKTDIADRSGNKPVDVCLGIETKTHFEKYSKKKKVKRFIKSIS